MTQWRRHGRIDGAIVMIGFGSIGKGTLPLIERHFDYDKNHFVVIGPDGSDRRLLDERGIEFVHMPITRENYREVLTRYLTAGKGQGFCVNLSVDTSSLAIMEHCREIGALYIDTVVEPWPGFYFDRSIGPEARSNYALRETVLAARRASPGGVTAVSCCGANPGMVSWLVKQALLNLAADLGDATPEPTIARRMGPARPSSWRERHPHRRARHPAREYPRSRSTSSSTPGRSKGSCPRACSPPNSAGARTRNGRPPTPGFHETGCGAAIYLNQPGANTRVRSWTPTAQAQYGYLVTHNEAISIADYYTRRDAQGAVIYRPTCHYAYHPCNDAVLSLHELFGRAGALQKEHHILGEAEIVDGIDELGVLLFGHKHNAYWYGSQLSVEEDARHRALSERHRHAGDLGRARRHGLGA